VRRRGERKYTANSNFKTRKINKVFNSKKVAKDKNTELI